MKILYVEDSELMRESLKAYLEDLGHEVMTASSIEEALEVLSKNPFDCFICDGTLRPGKDGNGVVLAQQLISHGEKAIVYSADTRYIPKNVPCVDKTELDALDRLLVKLQSL